MRTKLYALVRIFTLLAGWLIALALGTAADLMHAGAKWPVMMGLGCWWTLICTMYARGESERADDAVVNEFVPQLRAAKAALDALP